MVQPKSQIQGIAQSMELELEETQDSSSIESLNLNRFQGNHEPPGIKCKYFWREDLHFNSIWSLIRNPEPQIQHKTLNLQERLRSQRGQVTCSKTQSHMLAKSALEFLTGTCSVKTY